MVFFCAHRIRYLYAAGRLIYVYESAGIKLVRTSKVCERCYRFAGCEH